MRLDKFIGHSTGLSRAEVQRQIRHGAVTVNGQLVRKSSLILGTQDQVHLDGQTIALPQTRYLMLHKPSGYLCANSDGQHPTVLDLVSDAPGNVQNLQIVGRLDLDTSGLLLLTDDGQWNHRITSPRSQCPKTYRVTTADPISNDAESRFAEGLLLHGESRPTLPAQFTHLDTHTGLLTIHEGKYHQVKRMFAALGNRVIALHRESIGAVQLDPALAPGTWRLLNADEIAEF